MPEPADRKINTRLALTLVETCVRNTGLETLHAGRFPVSATGDFSDVTVVTPFGEIPWMEVSRISDLEMKALMIEITDRVFTYLTHPDAMAGIHTSTQTWGSSEAGRQPDETGRAPADREGGRQCGRDRDRKPEPKRHRPLEAKFRLG